MATSTVRGGHAPARRLKSPLAVPGASAGGASDNSSSLAPAPGRAALSDREATLAEFQGYLRTVNNRDGRPFEEKTITAYSDPVKSLDKWLTAKEADGDYDTVDTALLNTFFREYYLVHGQGGTHTLQRNLIQLFGFLERERGCPSPYNDGLNRYAAVKGRPKTLSGEFVDDLLEVTGGGRARDFETPATMPSSGYCAARESGGWKCSEWSCTRCPRT
jgi:integrase/recombinase XerD